MQSSASAAACTAGESVYGEAKQDIGTLPSTGIYTIWTRMQAANETSNRYQLEVNGEACYTIGGEGVSSTQWEWVNFQNGDQNKTVTYNFINSTGNQVRMLGIDPAVKIDSILVVPDNCVPEDTGENCTSATSIGSTASISGLNETMPVSGTVTFAVLFPSGSIEVKTVEYSSDGQKVQKSNGATGLDTTLLANGTHEVTAKVTYSDGTIESETHQLEVDNPTTALSPVLRWARLNKGLLVVIGGLLGIISVLGLIYAIMRRNHLRKHYARTHGLD